MAWIEIHQSLPTHRKTLALADALELEPVCALGHLVSFWLWTLDNAPNGVLSADITPRMMARAAQFNGSQGVFLEALLRVGFLEQQESGLVVHDWSVYAKRWADRKAKLEAVELERAGASADVSVDAPADTRARARGRDRQTKPEQTLPDRSNDLTPEEKTKDRPDQTHAGARAGGRALCVKCGELEVYAPEGLEVVEDEYAGLCGRCIIVQHQIAKGLRDPQTEELLV